MLLISFYKCIVTYIFKNKTNNNNLLFVIYLWKYHSCHMIFCNLYVHVSATIWFFICFLWMDNDIKLDSNGMKIYIPFSYKLLKYSHVYKYIKILTSIINFSYISIYFSAPYFTHKSSFTLIHKIQSICNLSKLFLKLYFCDIKIKLYSFSYNYINYSVFFFKHFLF